MANDMAIDLGSFVTSYQLKGLLNGQLKIQLTGHPNLDRLPEEVFSKTLQNTTGVINRHFFGGI